MDDSQQRRAVTRAQRWAMSIGYLRVTVDSLFSFSLGCRLSSTFSRSSDQLFLTQIKIVDTESCERFIESHFSMADYYLPGGDNRHKLKDSTLKLMEECGVEESRKALNGYILPQAIRVVHAGVGAGWLTPSEGWQHMLKVARFVQESYSSYADFLSHLRMGYRFMLASDQNKDFFDREISLQTTHPLGEFNTLPWDEDLTQSVPYQPKKLVCLQFTTTIECLNCLKMYPLQQLEDHTCPFCDAPTEVDASVVASIMEYPTECFLSGSRRSQMLTVWGTPPLSVQFDFGEPHCAWCRETLALDAELLEESPTRPMDIVCEHCGGQHRLSEPPAMVQEGFVIARAVILPMKPPVEVPRSFFLSCRQCGAHFETQAATTVCTCDSCQSKNIIPDDLFFQLKPRERAPSLQVIVADHASNRDMTFVPGIKLDRGHFPSTMNEVPVEMKPFGKAPQEARLSPRRRWILALGAVDIDALKGDLARPGGFPIHSGYQTELYRRAQERYPQISAQLVQAAFAGEIPRSLAKSPVSTLRYLLNLGRVGWLLGWLTEEVYWKALEAQVKLMLEDCQTWEDYAQCLARAPLRREHPRHLAQAIERAKKLWKDIPWAGQAPRSPDWDSIEVQGTLECPRCAWDMPILALQATTHVCPGCHSELQLRNPLERRLAPPLFTFRRSYEESDLVTDYTDEGKLHWFFRRKAPHCLRCRQELALELMAQAEFECPHCGEAHHSLHGDSLPGLSPSLIGILAAPKSEGKSQVVLCYQCGADLIVDGSERLVVCRYCESSMVLGDKIYRALRGGPQLRSLLLVFDSRLPEVPFNQRWSRSLCCNGHPAVRGTAS